MNRLAQAWHGRTERSRKVIAIVACLVALALVVALVWLPMERARGRLALELPALRASIAALERDAAEVKRLRALTPAPDSSARGQAPAGAQSPLATLATNGGGLPGAQIAVLDERRVRVTGGDVGWSALLEWLGNAQATHGMRVEGARLDALPAAGRVRAELVLTRS